MMQNERLRFWLDHRAGSILTIVCLSVIGLFITWQLIAPTKPLIAPKPTPTPAEAPGTLAGTLTVYCGNVQCDQQRSAFDIVVLTANGITPIAQSGTKPDGSFTFNLPPGTYRVQTLPQTDKTQVTVTVEANQSATAQLTVHVNAAP
jgi:VCBS repeat-containing protein